MSGNKNNIQEGLDCVMELIKNKIYRAELVDYTADGAAVARIGGIAVFVPGGAVGDQCDIKIIKVNRRMAYGRIEKIIVRSAARITPTCPYAGRCGGCCWQHITYEEELRAKLKKVSDALQRIGNITVPISEIIGADTIEAYRNKAQYPVRQTKEGIVTGFFRPRSHDIIAIDHCNIQSPKADLLAKLVRQWMDTYHISAYDEINHTGILRHIYVRTGQASGQVQLTLVSTTANLPASAQLITALTEAVPSLVGIILNVNHTAGNVILGKRNKILWGSDVLEDTLAGNHFFLSPHAFYQVNHAQAEKLYACALDFAQLNGTQTVMELYSGAGTITLAMARRAKRVIGVEVVPEAVENARGNAEYNGITNAEFFCADAGQAAMMFAEQGQSPDVLVVDPPRKGLDETAITAILKLQPERLVYVSCDPATLARDCRILQDNNYAVQKIKAFDLFPRTSHVETCVLLSHKNS